VSIAQQTATAEVARRSGPHALVLANPRPSAGVSLAKIAALVAATALAGAVVAGFVGLALVMLMSRVGG
jgi:hypothetical protein